MADDKPLNQTYYEEVEALKEQGVKNADAVRQVAEKLGKNENAVRGGIHQYKAKLNGGTTTTTRRRKAALTPDDLVSQARQNLEQALAAVDQVVTDAKNDLDAAQARYDEAVASVKDKKADIEKKLKAMA